MRSTAKTTRSEKIVLIGAASSGKTSLGNRFIHDKFSANSEATIGAAFISKVIQVDGREMKLDIWDTGGSEKYRSLAPMYFRDARAAIVVFDVTSQTSFEEAEDWIREFRERGSPSALVFGAANKCDLQAQRRVSPEDVKDFMFSHQLNYISETSALTGEGVNELFAELGKQLVALPTPHENVQIADLEEPPVEKKDDGCGC